MLSGDRSTDSEEAFMYERVADLMTEKVFAVAPRDDLSVISNVLADHDVRHVPVVEDDSRLVGVVSQRDLLRYTLLEGGDSDRDLEGTALEQLCAEDVMSAAETVEEETPLREAAGIMLENKFGCLPVVRGETLVGILTESDFVRAAVSRERW
jgi:CBS domain-containing membrane protein